MAVFYPPYCCRALQPAGPVTPPTTRVRRADTFAGSDEGAERAAILCTVLESDARHELDLGLYLCDVMLKLASRWPQSRLDEFLPHRCRKLHAKTAAQAHAQAAQQA